MKNFIDFILCLLGLKKIPVIITDDRVVDTFVTSYQYKKGDIELGINGDQDMERIIKGFDMKNMCNVYSISYPNYEAVIGSNVSYKHKKGVYSNVEIIAVELNIN